MHCQLQRKRNFNIYMAALLPIGPLTPFRSKFCSSSTIEKEMNQTTSLATTIYTKFARISLEQQQSGLAPNPADVAKLADEMSIINNQFTVILTRLSLAEDFQAIQLFKMTEARLISQGTDLRQMQEAMTWQVDSLRAYAESRPPPPPPPMVLRTMSGATGASAAGGGLAWSTGGFLTAAPFLEGSKALSSPVVRGEFERLAADNVELVRLGERYGSWDRIGRLTYIEQLEAVEERWRLFMARFELMGDLNPEFIQQSTEYVRSLGIQDTERFMDLIRRSRELMRADAERL